MSEKNPVVGIELANGKTIKVELYPDIAPISVENFLNLVKDGFYDGLLYDSGWLPKRHWYRRPGTHHQG